MTPLKRTLAAVSVPVLLALSLSACGGGGSSAPKGASKDDFCNTILDFSKSIASVDTSDTDAQVTAAHDLGDKLASVGTPDDIPDDARKGFEKAVDKLKDANADDVSDDSDPFSGDSDVEAFGTYLGTECADVLGGLGTDSGSGSSTDIPSIDPSDLTSGLPTDLPTDLLSDLPSGLPTDLPTDLLSDLPTDLLTDLPTDLLTS